MSIKVKAIFISSGHDFYGRNGQDRMDHGIQTVDTVECVAGKGLIGDRFFDYKDNYKGQVTFFDEAVFEDIKKAFSKPELEPSVFRRNVILSGANLNSMIGQPFSIQGIEFEGTEEAKPCYWMNEAVAEGAEQALRGRGGLRARIINDGVLQVEK
ncbi:MAG: MOSC domain-containing protein [Verrucomicrobiota bacterium]